MYFVLSLLIIISPYDVNSIGVNIGVDSTGDVTSKDKFTHYKMITMGFKGIKGTKGFQGIVGDIGDTGDKGVKGPTGEKGSEGLRGPDGKKGEIGLKGNIGQKGEEGPRGPQGEPGRPGLKGLDGPTGATGSTGISSTVKGESGDKGEKGESLGIDKTCEIISCPSNSQCYSYMENGLCVCSDGLSGQFCLIESFSAINDKLAISFVMDQSFIIPCHFKPFNSGYKLKMQVKSGLVFNDFVCSTCSFFGMDYIIPLVTNDITGEYRCLIQDNSSTVLLSVSTTVEQKTFEWSTCNSQCGVGEQILIEMCTPPGRSAYICGSHPDITRKCYTENLNGNCRKCWKCLSRDCKSSIEEVCSNVKTACISIKSGNEEVIGGCDNNGICPVSTTPVIIPAPLSLNGELTCCYENFCNII